MRIDPGDRIAAPPELGIPPHPARFIHRLGSWDLTVRARLVGILNVTPDSFSDGGRYLDPDAAIARAEQMVDEGVDAIDVGAQSTRPGSGPPVGAEEEWSRLAPVLGALRGRVGVPLSIDTYWAEVARRALDSGVAIVNDVSGLRVDPPIADLAARSGAGLILMHSEGAPSRLHEAREYGDIAAHVRDSLRAAMERAVGRGVPEERIALDPGIGFSKRAEQSVAVLRGLPLLTSLRRPLYIGVSRKSFLGALSGAPADRRLAAGLGATVTAYTLGGRIFRTHDVPETLDALRTAEALLRSDAHAAPVPENRS